MKPFRAKPLILGLALLGFPLRAQSPETPQTEATPTAAPAASKSEAPAQEKKSDSNEGFDPEMIPQGQPIKGLKVPYYAADGTTLLMTIEAATARRLDDSNIEMEDLRIDAVDEEQKKFQVEMPQSVFNIETRALSGEHGVLIKREDFEIRGQQAEFDVKARFGKVIGNVRMIIYNTDQIE